MYYRECIRCSFTSAISSNETHNLLIPTEEIVFPHFIKANYRQEVEGCDSLHYSYWYTIYSQLSDKVCGLGLFPLHQEEVGGLNPTCGVWEYLYSLSNQHNKLN